MLYYIVFFVIAMAVFARLLGDRYSKWLYVLTIIILVAYSGCRNAFIYPDIDNYYSYYTYGESGYLENFGVGYTALNAICVFLNFPFQAFLVINAIIVILGYTRAIKEYSPMIWLSLLLYILINFYPSFFLLRQYLSMAVFLFSIKYIIERKPVHFMVSSLLSVSLHATAIITIPLYFLYGMKNSKKNMLLLIIGLLVFVFVFSAIGGPVQQYFDYYAHYFQMRNEESAWQRAVMKAFILGIFLFTFGKGYYERGVTRIVFYFMIINVVVCIAAINVFGVFRLREYFSFADFVGVPVILKEVQKKKSIKSVVVVSMTIIYIVALVLSFNNFVTSDNMNNLYQFFWESNNTR